MIRRYSIAAAVAAGLLVSITIISLRDMPLKTVSTLKQTSEEKPQISEPQYDVQPMAIMGVGGPEEEVSAIPTVVKYTVKEGDTLESISANFGVKISTIAESNNLKSNSSLKDGQALSFPSTDGVLYEIQNGETLWDLAYTYDIGVDDIIDINAMDSPDKLKIGQKLILPGVEKIKPRKTTTASPAASRKTASAKGMWPARGRVTSKYGKRWGRNHNGIDIAAPTGTPVYAFMKGKVTFSGWQGGYGYLVIINHGNGLQTYYGHNSKLLVKSGQSVEKGARIASVGSTGNSTGPHCHFEVRKNGVPVNPYNYLK